MQQRLPDFGPWVRVALDAAHHASKSVRLDVHRVRARDSELHSGVRYVLSDGRFPQRLRWGVPSLVLRRHLLLIYRLKLLVAVRLFGDSLIDVLLQWRGRPASLVLLS
jgi:hypothetical protein